MSPDILNRQLESFANQHALQDHLKAKLKC